MNIKDPLIIIGNGPSFKDVDLELIRGRDTYGLNGAYKIYPELNWYPKYWSSFDDQWIRSGNRHKDINKMIHDRTCLIEHFILLGQIHPWNYRYSEKLLLTNESGHIFKTPYRHEYTPSLFSATRIGICLGYTKIIYLGVDCSYGDKNTFQYFDNRVTEPTDPVESYPKEVLISNYNHSHITNVNSWSEYLSACNSIHEDSFKAMLLTYPDIEFVNCSGPKSNVKAIRIANLKEELT